MPHLPLLRVVPLENIRQHEEIDPLRVARLVDRIEAEGIQGNPMICCNAPDGELILLDGATRTESLRRIGLEHAVVQMVEPDAITLETWHHVVRGCSGDEFVESLTSTGDAILGNDPSTPRIHLQDGDSKAVVGTGVSPNSTLTSLVASYVGKWRVNRVTDPSVDVVSWSYPDWSVVVEFPTLTLDDVVKAALSEDLLPAGITRFLVEERALRVNAPIDLLTGTRSLDEKQGALDELLAERASNGRVRRYEETIFILDE